MWNMTIGQLILYHNLGIELKYGTGDNQDKPKSVADMSYAELAAKREELRRQYGAVDG